MKHGWLRSFLAGVALLMAATLWATTVVPMSVEELTAASSDVVYGRAGSSHSAWDADHRLIYTYTTFSVVRTMKGASSGTVVVKQIGGSADGYTQKVAGVRRWTAGEEAVLFLRDSGEPGARTVTGLFQGDFSVKKSATGETVVSNGVPNVSSFNPRSHSLSQYRGTQLTMQELENRVKGATAR